MEPASNVARSARVVEGSGNVFADIGVPNPNRELIKASLTLRIHPIIKDSAWTQAEAAKLLGIRKPHVSLLMRNRSGSLSIGKLLEFLTALGQDVEIVVKPARKRHGEMVMVEG